MADCPLLHLLELLPSGGVLPYLLHHMFPKVAAVSKSFRSSPQFEKVAPQVEMLAFEYELLCFFLKVAFHYLYQAAKASADKQEGSKKLNA